MEATQTVGPYLDEIDARIAEAKSYGCENTAAFAAWQKRFIKRQWEASNAKAARARRRA